MVTFLRKLTGDSQKIIKQSEKLVTLINELEDEFENLSDTEIDLKVSSFKEELSKGKTLDDVLVPAFALVREIAKRTIGQRHYDVQLIGGIVLHNGQIAEMKTGEGKTLVATLPAFLNALSASVHVVTVNDYLAMRDAAWGLYITDWACQLVVCKMTLHICINRTWMRTQIINQCNWLNVKRRMQLMYYMELIMNLDSIT